MLITASWPHLPPGITLLRCFSTRAFFSRVVWDEHKSCTGKLVLWKWKRFCYIYSLLVSSWNMANYYDVMIVTMEGPL